MKMKPIAGAGLLSLSLFMLLGFFKADLSAGTAVQVMTFLLTVGLPAGGGIALIRSHRKEVAATGETNRQRTLERVQADLLKLARDQGSKLTVVEATAELGLSSATVEEALKALHTKGLAEVQVTDSGMIVYAIPDIELLDEKDTARGLLDD